MEKTQNNVGYEIKVEKKQLVVKIDLTSQGQLSQTGKSIIKASSAGFIPVAMSRSGQPILLTFNLIERLPKANSGNRQQAELPTI